MTLFHDLLTSRKRRRQQRQDGTASGRSYCGVVVVHAAGQPGAVVDQMKLASERHRVRGTSLRRQIGERGTDPGPEVIGRLFVQIV
jgi:hypothetical protein